jgi:hypothetical protein
MAVKVSRSAFEYAQRLIKEEKRFVADERDNWSEHQPTAAQENEFIEEHGYREYAHWHLGVDDEAREETKGRYKFPYGTSATSTAAASSRRRYGPRRTSTATSRPPPRICTA